ncbi:MAG: PQQ-binding-like beta-propeller repeat protein [Pirellulales bacterium]
MVRPNARRVPGLAIQIVLIVCVLGTIAGYWWGSEFDRAIPNIVALVTTFVAATSLLGWFAFRSSYPPLLRLLVPLSVVGVIVMLAACFRIEETTGTLIPVLRPRWEPKADQKLSQPETELAKDAIDLSPTESDFPRFLGPQGIPVVAMPDPPLARDWSTQPPKQLWKQPIGGGWGGFSVVHGYAVTLEQRGDEELVTCYEVRTGKLVWSHSTTTRHETVLGGVGPRSTPLIHDGRVYALGAHGLLRCLDGQTGKLLWTYDVYEKTSNTPEKDITLVAWGRSGSPLLVDDKVVIPVGGPPGGPFVSLVALDRLTGEEIWKAGSTQVSYASPLLVQLGGRSQIINVNEASVTGHDPETGGILWEREWIGHSNGDANTSQPIVLPEDRLLLTKGYGVGAALFQLKPSGDKFELDEIWRRPRSLRTKFTSVAVHDGHAYGLSDGILECVELEKGASRWKHRGFEHGQVLLVGDLLLVLSETGELALVEATPASYRQIGSFQALEGKTWNTLCLTGRLLLIRNGQEAGCWELP